MDDMMREALEKRALDLWQDAGSPSGAGLHYWLLAELELGVLKKVHRHDPFVVLSRMAAHARREPSDQLRDETVIH
jgi:hypothetical protein